jgi:predicted TIM-barrel fold metal-dependent hydrolase
LAGRVTEHLPFQPQAFPMLWSERPGADAAGAWVCHGAMSRFPQLKVMIVELGGSWLEPLVKQLENLYKKMPQEFTEHPVEVLKRNLYLCPFWEDDFVHLAELLGEDHVLFGSDWPHPEGLAQPRSFLDDLAGLPEATVAKFMGGNLARVMGIEARV